MKRVKRLSEQNRLMLSQQYHEVKDSHDAMISRNYRLRKICWVTMILSLCVAFMMFRVAPLMTFLDYFIFWFAFFSDMWAWKTSKRGESQFSDIIVKMKEVGFDAAKSGQA